MLCVDDFVDYFKYETEEDADRKGKYKHIGTFLHEWRRKYDANVKE
jgi:hypothetical protein